MAMGAAAVALVCVIAAVFASWIAPHDPFNLATLELSDSMLPPAWMEGGTAKYPLGTDEQGRDVLSALMFGARISLFVGSASVLVSLLVGVGLGLLSGYVGGRLDALIMRVCDVMLSFPSILIALLFAGVGHALFPNANDLLAFGVVIVAIALPGWVQYARAVRGSTMVERHKEYVQAARVIGVPPLRIMFATSCRTSWVRCSSSRPSRLPWRSSPRRRCRSSASASRPRRPPWVPSSTKATSSCSAAPGGW
jgi:peptide/nickel transport system permease protein